MAVKRERGGDDIPEGSRDGSRVLCGARCGVQARAAALMLRDVALVRQEAFQADCTKDKDGGLPRTVRVRVKEISRAWTAADEARSIAWRALHVGEWSAVSDQWRAMFALSCRLATGILLSTGSRELSPPCIIRILDEALMMGGPHHAGASHELIELVNGADSARSIGSTPVTFDLHEIPPPPLPHGLACQPQDVPRLKQPSLATFFEACMRAEQPTVIEKAMQDWPAMCHDHRGPSRRWADANYLLSVAGSRTVPVELGKSYTDDDWRQQLMPLKSFVENHLLVKSDATSGGGSPTTSKGYLAQHPLFAQVPKLRRDICVPDYCALTLNSDTSAADKPQTASAPEVNAWLGPRGTVSALHHDPKHNLLAQVVGAKRIKLYDASETTARALCPKEGLLGNTSSVDAEAPDTSLHSEFLRLPFYETTLRAGEM